MLYLAELTALGASHAVTTGLKVVTTVTTEAAIEAFLNDRKARGLSSRTVQFYHDKLTYVSRNKPLLSLTRQDIQQVLMSLKCNPGGKHAYLRAFRAFYSWAEDSSLISDNPCRKLSLKVPKPLRYAVQVSDIATLLEACETVRDRLIVSMLADTGLRLSELASIRLEDVDFASQIVKVWGKGAKQRVVRYGPQTAAIMAQYSPPLTGITLFDIKPRGISIMLDRLGQRTGIKCNAHAFRRTFATQSVRNGVNLFYVQSLLGHSTLTMTRIYAEQVNSEDAIKAYKPIVV